MYTCSLRDCLEGELNDQTGRIEVCTALPRDGRKRKNQYLIKWTAKGGAAFHRECWTSLLKSARARNPKHMDHKLSLGEKAMIREAAKTAERHDAFSVIRQEAQRIAQLIEHSEHCAAFTGAGISTSAGIGDYRGKSGKWTEEDRSRVALADGEPSAKCARKTNLVEQTDAAAEAKVEEEKEGEEGVPYENLRPTYTHEALQHLMELGYLKYIISQNGDGLHTLSGVSEDRLSELHGNVFIEKCEACDRPFHRPFYVLDDHASQYLEEIEDYGKTDIVKPKHLNKCQLCGLSHRTGRRCDRKGCSGYLMDTIINFRDNLEEEVLDRATEHARKCDLMLCLGTTLKVTPASDLVEMGQRPLRLVVCNRQETHMDTECLQLNKDTKLALGSRVFGDCDLLMKEILKHLLPEDELRTWEAGRSTRLRQYDQQRRVDTQ